VVGAGPGVGAEAPFSTCFAPSDSLSPVRDGTETSISGRISSTRGSRRFWRRNRRHRRTVTRCRRSLRQRARGKTASLVTVPARGSSRVRSLCTLDFLLCVSAEESDHRIQAVVARRFHPALGGNRRHTRGTLVSLPRRAVAWTKTPHRIPWHRRVNHHGPLSLVIRERLSPHSSHPKGHTPQA
jgi:hypothetical protein